MLPVPGRSLVRACLGRLLSRWGRLVQARPSSPLLWSWLVSVGLRFFFSLAFSGFARSGLGVLVLVFSLGSSSFLVRSPSWILLRVLISSSCSFQRHFLSSSSSPHWQVTPCSAGCVCVCVERLNRRKTSRRLIIYINILILMQGVTGVPGSRWPMKTPPGARVNVPA